ncbi:hypothetical protein FRUB_06207 [Fimbriiglobus ruber]|uniref:DNA mimic protein DMP19 C-terminal domain-containing protein n=2 Tax=Fimbriiglobus ruber TaxID=1908690 RepID=A0A225DRW4_9BACT|nr:hypothetical protein FRUB_06207 [Fimbriiglobus ruber]
MNHADVMNSCDTKADRVGMANLTQAEQVIVMVSRANFEIELGGLSAFFYNSAGNYAVETVAALEAIGAENAAGVLRTAIARFPGGSVPTDREQRYAGWMSVSGSFGPLDQEYYRNEPDVFSRLCAFIDAHAAELWEHAEEV